MSAAAVLARFLGPGLAVAVGIGLLSGWFRGGERSGIRRADFALSALLALSLAALHVAAARDLVPLVGRVAFLGDSALLHLTAYLAGALVGLAGSRIARGRGSTAGRG